MTTVPSMTRTLNRRRYRTKALLVQAPEFVALSEKDEERAIAALSELLAPLFNADGSIRSEAEEAPHDS